MKIEDPAATETLYSQINIDFFKKKKKGPVLLGATCPTPSSEQFLLSSLGCGATVLVSLFLVSAQDILSYIHELRSPCWPMVLALAAPRPLL